MELILPVANGAGRAPLIEPGHKAPVLCPVIGVAPDPGELPAHALEAGPCIEQGYQPGPGAGKIAGQQQGVVLAHDSIAGMRPIGPVNKDTDHGIINRPELGDGLVRTSAERIDEAGLAAQLAKGSLQVSNGSPDLGPGPLIGQLPVVSGQKDRDVPGQCSAPCSVEKLVVLCLLMLLRLP